MRLLAISISTLICVAALSHKKSSATSPGVARNDTSPVKKPWKEPPRDCSDAPNKDIKHTCLMMLKGDQEGRKKRKPRQANNNVRGGARAGGGGPPSWLTPIPVPGNARGQFAYHPYDCMTISCLCPFFRGQMRNSQCILSNGVRLEMAYRKEYRMMSDAERNRWHNAMNTLKRNGEYDRLSRQHLDVGIGSGAHSGPGFLPWHREYLKRVEIALRMVDPLVSIPYWDSVMDNYLPDARDSIMFSNLFAGESDYYGNVIQGPFAYWRTLEGRSTILRQLGREGSLFNENQVNNIVAQNTIENTMAYTAPQAGCPFYNNYGAIEYIHSNIHLWIGGDMKPPSTSANEPIFFMHHSFVDYIWELWRQLKQPRWLREQAYSADNGYCSNWQHFSYSNMRPFPYLVNRDGLSNSYTDQMYRYAPRATCSVQRPNCGSPYLFCDTRGYPHCVAKVRMNGLCRGFENYDVCYRGRCWWGRCVAGGAARMHGAATHGNETSDRTMMELPTTTSSPMKVVAMSTPLFNDCFNRHPCCSSWEAAGECSRQPEYMSQYCSASCAVCSPSYNATNDCTDRHIQCKNWKDSGMCKGEAADFMSENCRESCGKCSLPKKDQCFSNGVVINLPASTTLIEDIKESHEPKVEREILAAKKKRMTIKQLRSGKKMARMHVRSGRS